MLARLLLVAATIAASPVLADARDLVVAANGSSLQAATRETFARPFTAATGIATQVATWDGGMEALHAQPKPPDDGWDIVLADGNTLAAGCSDGTFEKLDWSVIGGKDHYLPQAVSDCGVGAFANSLALAWNRDKFPATPTWSDFWDVAKYPGKRGLRRGVQGNLEFALIADGVAPGDVYKVLGTSDGVDRAFRKLDQLKPYIVWWQTGGEATKILASGDVLMTSAPVSDIVIANHTGHHNFAVQWAASLYDVLSWAIVKGTANQRQATQFLYFAGTPAIEARLVGAYGEGGWAKGANDGLPTELAQASPTAAANLNAAVRIDAGFWHDNLAKLRQRFDAWLGH